MPRRLYLSGVFKKPHLSSEIVWCTTFGPPQLSVNEQNPISNVIENYRKECEEYRQFLFRYNICSKYFALIRKLVNFVQLYLFGHGLYLKADFIVIQNHR